MIYWFRRPLGTVSEALALHSSVLADIYVEQRNQMIGFSVAAMVALVVEFLPGTNEALVLPLALAGTLLAYC